MNSKEINKVFDLYLHHFGSHLEQSLKTMDEKTIHNLRVAIKRINAVVEYLGEGDFMDFSNNLYFLEMKHLFKTAGNLRELQINQEILKDYPLPRNKNFGIFKSYLNALLDLRQQQFTERMEKYSLEHHEEFVHEIRNAMSQIPREDLRNQTFNYIKSRIRKTENYMNHDSFVQYLHEVRKLIKQIRFVLEMAREASMDLDQIQLSVEHIMEVEKILGRWHDQDVLIGYIREFINENEQLDQAHQAVCKEVIKDIERNNLQLVMDIQPGVMNTVLV